MRNTMLWFQSNCMPTHFLLPVADLAFGISGVITLFTFTLCHYSGGSMAVADMMDVVNGRPQQVATRCHIRAVSA